MVEDPEDPLVSSRHPHPTGFYRFALSYRVGRRTGLRARRYMMCVSAYTGAVRRRLLCGALCWIRLFTSWCPPAPTGFTPASSIPTYSTRSSHQQGKDPTRLPKGYVLEYSSVLCTIPVVRVGWVISEAACCFAYRTYNLNHPSHQPFVTTD